MFAYKVVHKDYVTAHKALCERLRRIRAEVSAPLEAVITKYQPAWTVLQATPEHDKSEYERGEQERIERVCIEANREADTAYYEASRSTVHAINALEEIAVYHIVLMPGQTVDEALAENGVFYMDESHEHPMQAIPIVRTIDVALATVSDLKKLVRDIQQGNPINSTVFVSECEHADARKTDIAKAAAAASSDEAQRTRNAFQEKYKDIASAHNHTADALAYFRSLKNEENPITKLVKERFMKNER